MLKPGLPRTVFALVCGFCVILLAAWFSPSTGEICKETKPGHEQCASYNLAPFLIIQIFKALHTLEGAITALATVAIAWFTWTLWQSSEKMWGVTSRAAAASENSTEIARQALFAGQRAWLDISDIKANDLTFDVNGARISLTMTLINRGPTPAFEVEPWISAFMLGDQRQPFTRTDVSGRDMAAPNTMFPGVPREREVNAYIRHPGSAHYIAQGGVFPVNCEVVVEYRTGMSTAVHRTAHTVMLNQSANKLLLILSNPPQAITGRDIGFAYMPGGSMAN